MKNTGKKIVVGLIEGLLVAAVLVGIPAGWSYLSDNKIPNVRRTMDLYVYPDTAPEEVLASLDSVVARPKSVARAFKEHRVADYIKPGHYLVKQGQTSVYICRMLNNGWQSPVRLSLTGNLRIKGNIAAKIASQLLLDSATVHQALDDDRLLAEYARTVAEHYNTRDLALSRIKDQDLLVQFALTGGHWLAGRAASYVKDPGLLLEIAMSCSPAAADCASRISDPEAKRMAEEELKRKDRERKDLSGDAPVRMSERLKKAGDDELRAL